MSIHQVENRIREIQSLIGETSAPNEAFGSVLQQAQSEVDPGGEALRAGAGGPAPQWVQPLIAEAARKTGVSPELITSVMRTESGFNPRAVSPAGAQGLMQLMPGTAAGLGVTNPFDPRQSVLGGAEYLREQLARFGNVEKAVAAYNAGPGAVQRCGGVPPYRETQNYVDRVLGSIRGPATRRE